MSRWKRADQYRRLANDLYDEMTQCAETLGLPLASEALQSYHVAIQTYAALATMEYAASGG